MMWEPDDHEHPAPEPPPAPEPSRPPLVCEVCYRTQVFHPFDLKHDAFYCPHFEGGGVYAIRNPDGKTWRIRTGCDPGLHRLIVGASEKVVLARAAAEQRPS